MYAEVAAILASLGHAPGEQAAVQYAIDKAEQRIKDNTNLSEVPRGLRFVWARMAAGLYLYDLMASGQLAGFDAPAKVIEEGDTSITFMGSGDGVSSPEERFGRMLDGMIHPPDEQLAAYRRLRW